MDRNRIPKQALRCRPKGRKTQDDRRRDGGTNYILKIKEQETRITLHEHEDNDDDDVCKLDFICTMNAICIKL